MDSEELREAERLSIRVESYGCAHVKYWEVAGEEVEAT
jgi:hypothetical protein